MALIRHFLIATKYTTLEQPRRGIQITQVGLSEKALDRTVFGDGVGKDGIEGR